MPRSEGKNENVYTLQLDQENPFHKDQTLRSTIEKSQKLSLKQTEHQLHHYQKNSIDFIQEVKI